MPRASADAEVGIRARAFGIDIESTFAIPCLDDVAPNGGPSTYVERAYGNDLSLRWKPKQPVTVIERRVQSGRRFMSIEHDAELGFNIWADRFGRHLITNDGLHVRSSLPGVPPWRWQRLLFAQVLPLAATLRGLDPFHASAVAIDGRAVAFVATSGTGKTSLAAHLVADGGTFLTDDVLSVEVAGDDVVAHPGPGMTSVAPEQLADMTLDGRERLGWGIGRERGKKHFRPPVAARPYKLSALFFVSREPGIERLTIEQQQPDPRTLLSSSFIPYIRSTEHLVTHLETCARIAETVPVSWLKIPSDVGARQAAASVRERLGTIVE